MLKEKIKNENGITLVALVITIIIMLILVAVSITVAFKGGMFNTAEKAKDKTQEAIDKEKLLDTGRIEMDEIWYDSIEDYIEGKASYSKLKVGDYVNYPVYYNNVETNIDITTGKTSHIPADEYTGWRVLSIDEENQEVELVSAGVPLNYYHQNEDKGAEISISALTTNFFSTQISETPIKYSFYSCGFKIAEKDETKITEIEEVKELFNNKYTKKTETGDPEVRSITKKDVDKIYGSDSAWNNLSNSEYNSLLAISCKENETREYAFTYMASQYGNKWLWDIREDANVGKSNERQIGRCKASC